jgi:hypothetical protein
MRTRPLTGSARSVSPSSGWRAGIGATGGATGGAGAAATRIWRLACAPGAPFPSTVPPVKIVDVEAPSLSVTTNVAV